LFRVGIPIRPERRSNAKVNCDDLFKFTVYTHCLQYYAAMHENNQVCTLIATMALLTGGVATLHASEENRYRAAGEYSAAHGGVSLLILKAGEIVYEDYPNDGDGDTTWVITSATTSFWGVLVAAMVQDGELGLDEKVADTITEWQSNKMKSWITVRQLLSMTSGLAGRPPGGGRLETYEMAVSLAVTREPGTRFSYQPAPYQVFGELVRRKVSGRYESPLAYLQARIFDPLDIAPADWSTGPDGNPRMPHGSEWTARDWGTFGEFVRRGGNWKGEQLVDADALAASFTGSPANSAYGIGWWLPRDVPPEVFDLLIPDARDFIEYSRRTEDFPQDMFMAAGAGKQRLYIFPALEMVVVRQQFGAPGRPRRGEDGEQRFADAGFLSLLLGLPE
jgi:CubicO group peptidase (beta-lactamase class C family)